MKILELLDELEEIMETGTGLILTGKIMVDPDEVLEIVKEIRAELPEEMEQAKWIKSERQRILDEAKAEHEAILKEARIQSESLIENDDITIKAKMRADEIMRVAENHVRNLKISTFDYIDSILFNFQDKMEQMNAIYLNDMFHNLEKTFQGINDTITANRNEIKELSYRTQMESE